jgi:hypothetical protein
MTPREVVKRAIHFGSPPRVPLIYRSDPERSDMAHTGYAPARGWQAPSPTVDEWGCEWANIIGTGCGQIVRHPLATPDDLATYPFPDALAPGRLDHLPGFVQSCEGKYLSASVGLSGFNHTMALRGFEELLTDLYVDRAFFEELADRVFAFENAIIDGFAAHGLDGVWFFDDWGTETGVFVRPEQWREVFKPRYADQFARVRRHGMDVLLHSCGHVWDIIPDLIEIGVSVLNLEQPLVFSKDGVNGIDRLAEAFGGKVCFCTNVDSQRTLISGTLAEIEAEAEHVVRALGRPEGGLIVLADCGKDHHIASDERTGAMTRAFERCCGGRDE